MGIKDVEVQNKAAFAHLVWRFLTSPNALWSRVFRQIYLRHWDFSDVEARPSYPWQNLWDMLLPSTIKLFIGKLLLDRLLTRQRLSRWNSSIQPTCPLCWNALETVDHLFTTCDFVKMLWAQTPSPTHIQPPLDSVQSWFWSSPDQNDRHFACFLFWQLWKARNLYIFQSCPLHPIQIISRTIYSYIDGV